MNWKIVACTKDEGPYIFEWAIYHRLIGCKEITLYDAGTDFTMEVLRPLIEEKFIKIIPWTIYPAQWAAYQHHLEYNQEKSDTMTAFIDADEFIFCENKSKVSDLLDKIPERASGMALGWMVFGSNGQERPESPSVIKNYTKRQDYEKEFDCFTKCIIKPWLIEPKVFDPHFFKSKHPNYLVRPNGSILNWPDHHHRFKWTYPMEEIRLNHYFCKSRADFNRKVKRRGPDGGARALHEFDVCNERANAVHDQGILSYYQQIDEEIKTYGGWEKVTRHPSYLNA